MDSEEQISAIAYQIVLLYHCYGQLVLLVVNPIVEILQKRSKVKKNFDVSTKYIRKQMKLSEILSLRQFFLFI